MGLISQIEKKTLYGLFLTSFFAIFLCFSQVSASEGDYYIWNTAAESGTNVPSGPSYDVAQDWEATTTLYLQGVYISLWNSVGNTGNVTVNICEGEYDDMDCTGDLLKQRIYVASNLPTSRQFVYIPLDSEYYWVASTSINITVQTDEAPNISVYRLGNVIPGGSYWLNEAQQSANDLQTALLVNNNEFLSYVDADVEIVELEGPDDFNVQTGSLIFDYPEDVYCFYDVDQATYPCKIKYEYPFNMIGYWALLLYSSSTVATDYLELDILEDTMNLKGDFSATIRTTERNDYYHIFTFDPDDETGSSSSLTGTISVHWISSTTDEAVLVPGILKFFTKVFPVSVIIQIRDFLNEYRTQPAGYEEMTIGLDWFFATSSGFSVTGNVFEARWAEETFDWYGDLVVYIINVFIAVGAVILIFKQMRMIFGAGAQE